MRIEWSSFFSYNLKHGDELTLQVKMYVDWFAYVFCFFNRRSRRQKLSSLPVRKNSSTLFCKISKNIRENFDLQACKE